MAGNMRRNVRTKNIMEDRAKNVLSNGFEFKIVTRLR
jgi:hypothetical protein